MKYKIDEIENGVIVRDVKHFNPVQVAESGQVFRWNALEDDSVNIVSHGKLINIKREKEDIVIRGTNKSEFENIWYDYFDLGRDYVEIRNILSGDIELDKAMEYGEGLRMVNQDPFETTITFIISANNQIPRIKKSVELIAKTYGEAIGEYDGETVYSFPSPEVLSKADVAEIREITRVGFRDQRIVDTSKMIANGEMILDELYNLNREEARNELIKFPGVGEKVADCILLFAYKFADSFPVDVWVQRIMETLYLEEPIPKKHIGDFGRKQFGELAGIAQQFLFYYGRENKIGK
ncbi:MAG: 8-oxoguanine DNA glycosylase [Tissierellia bacterium]|nr:8-oxoguanine DNA glycosylase [Tissierellia bacterium]